MNKFNNTEYKILVTDLIGDIFYVETSFRGKISFIRQYAEVIMRKLLDLDQQKRVTLGQNDIKIKLSTLNNHHFIENASKVINKHGSNSTHTQFIDDVSRDDFDTMVDKLFDMLAFLLINYFEKHEFGSKNEVMSSFSLLPPIIRYKVLIFLYEKYPNNISIIDKLVLVIIKAYNVDEAIRWVEEKKDILIKMELKSEKEFNEMAEKRGIEWAILLQSIGHSNMYDLCKDKISKVGNAIALNGTLYSDFESALSYYQKNGILLSNEPELEEFNDIMNFLYLGRKEKLKELSTEKKPYVVTDFIF